jgi:hypothetical protein
MGFNSAFKGLKLVFFLYPYSKEINIARWGVCADPRPGVDALENRKKYPAPGWVPDGDKGYSLQSVQIGAGLNKRRV